MVQRKGPDIAGCNSEQKKSPAKTEKHRSSNQHQDMRSKGGAGDLKKKLKKARSIKRISELENFEAQLGHQHVQLSKPSTHKKQSPMKAPRVSSSTPNYMKPTTSSDARKEQLQVSAHHPIASDKSKSPRNSSRSNPPRISSSSASGHNKPAKILKRKSSLKPIKPLMKKCSGTPLFPNINVSKATCSSTLKDSKFPRELELNPGGTESDGTSAMKVCPFTYCSLNGHWHESLPPLKCFLSAKRRSLKTQKSMKLKGLSSIKKRSLGKGEKQINIELAANETPPLIKEESDDFFIEIYATSHHHFADSATDESSNHEDKDITDKSNEHEENDADDVNSDIFNELLFGGDYTEGVEVDPVNEPFDECYSEMSFYDDLDQPSEFSILEIEVMAKFLEYIEYQNQVEIPNKDKYLCSLKDYGNGISKGFPIKADCESECEATEMDWDDEMPEYTDDGTGGEEEYQEEDRDVNDAIQFLYGNSSDSKPVHQDYMNELSGLDGIDEPYKLAAAHNSFTDVSHENFELLAVESLEGNEQVANDTSRCMDEIFFSLVFSGSDKELNQETTKASNMKSEKSMEDADSELDGRASESIENEAVQNMMPGNENSSDYLIERKIDNDENADSIKLKETQILNQSITEINLNMAEGDSAEEESESGTDIRMCDEVIATSKLSESIFAFQSSDQSDAGNSGRKVGEIHQSEESINEITKHSKPVEDDGNGVNEELEVDDNIESVAEEKCLDTSLKSLDENVTIVNVALNPNQMLPETDGKLKAKINISRKKVDEDSTDLKAFNPRAPNFLPGESDPESEKVDLRHQMMDERKNAEEWMIDYALQRVVTKLGPARKKKVELLVTAFETIIPIPASEAPVRHGNMVFSCARPMQACS